MEKSLLLLKSLFHIFWFSYKFLLLWMEDSHLRCSTANKSEKTTPLTSWSLLFFTRFLWYLQGKFVQQSRFFWVHDYLIHSHDLNVWIKGSLLGWKGSRVIKISYYNELLLAIDLNFFNLPLYSSGTHECCFSYSNYLYWKNWKFWYILWSKTLWQAQ